MKLRRQTFASMPPEALAKIASDIGAADAPDPISEIARYCRVRGLTVADLRGQYGQLLRDWFHRDRKRRG